MVMSRREIRKSLSTNFNPGLRHRLERAKLRTFQASHLPGLLTGGHLDRPIFIIGGPRSGTHFLYLTLRDHSHLAHWRPSEAHEVWEADYHPSLRGWESNVLGPADIRPDAAARIKRSFYLCAGGSKRFIDKTPRNVLRVPFIDALFPDARYIFLQRDGRETTNSLINAWRSTRYKTYRLPEPHSIPGTDPAWWKFVLYPGWLDDTRGPLEVVAAKQWALSNDYALDALREVPEERWLKVRYE
ncbi:MAG: sulfotransferase, partial [Actinobacteria bacterium]|nr:sulfotransferase [Actinomycetota bacterium]